MLVHAWLQVYYFIAEIVVIQSSYRIHNLFLIKIPKSWNSCWNTPSLDCHHRKQHCRSNLTYSFIFSHNLCTIAKNVVWDWNADITWYISFFNMCFGSTNKRKGIYPRYSCIFEWRFHNRSVTLFIQYVYQTPSYTVIKYHTLHITSP